jgi:Mg-chelatase subunit ChlD
MKFKNFLREEQGGMMPIFAITLVPIMSLVGASVDLAGVMRAHTRLQVAIDSTALAVNHDLYLTTVQTNLSATANSYFAKQTVGLENPVIDHVDFDVADGRVDLSATATYTPQVLTAFGLGPYTIRASAQSVVGDQSIEVALVLDNSGSMAGNRLKDLKTAAKSLTTILFDTVSLQNRIKISVVPFSGAVNVGPTNKDKTWMDTNALSPAHSENFISAKSRFDLFTTMNTPWAGCVESRGGTHMVTDSEPKTTDPVSLFVPMFAPDELDEPGEVDNPGRNENGKEYANSYLDDAGSCTQTQKNATNTELGKQKRICKYTGVTPNTEGWGSTNRGPNFWCNSKPIVPLTTVEKTITDTIDAMVAKGYTNIHEGLMWGWRVLSPGEPFTDGTAYGTPNVRKYIILMTDGENTINGRGTATVNRSDYSAYGYATNNRLAANSSSMTDAQLKGAMDARLKTACANAKNDDPAHPEKISIFTVAFHVSDQTTLDLLAECASSPSMAKKATSGTELDATFSAIARDLGKLRLTH